MPNIEDYEAMTKISYGRAVIGLYGYAAGQL